MAPVAAGRSGAVRRGTARLASPAGSWALLLLLATACGREAPPPERSWTLVDDLFLASSPDRRGPLLLCGRFEVTERELRGAGAEPATADTPAVMVSRDEAQRWAADRGLRLPTRDEWLHLSGFSSSTDGSPVWGSSFVPGTANTAELGLHRALPVGVFERGRSRFGGYDFVGNVWEWVSDAGEETPEGWPARAAALGGSFAAMHERASATELRVLEAGERASDLGFRVVADAEDWIEGQLAVRWATAGSEARRGLAAGLAEWRADLRRELARRVEARGVDPELCSLLREPLP